MTGKHTHEWRADAAPVTAVPEGAEPKSNWWGLPTLSEALTDRPDEQAAPFAARMRRGLLAASDAIGLQALDDLLEAEATELVGLKGKHDPDRSHVRHGGEDGSDVLSVVLGGRRVAARRPRMRAADAAAEASLEGYGPGQDEQPSLPGAGLAGGVLLAVPTRGAQHGLTGAVRPAICS